MQYLRWMFSFAALAVACGGGASSGRTNVGDGGGTGGNGNGGRSPAAGGRNAGSGGRAVNNGGGGGDVMTGTSPRPCGAAVDASAGFRPGVWKNLSPGSANIGNSGTRHVFGQGLTVDPSNPSTVYVTISGFDEADFSVIPGNLCRSTDGGATWAPVGDFVQPLNIRVDPNDSQHMYAGDGVRGSTNGFWVTRDGGATWTLPKGFADVAESLHDRDVYHVEPDPSDFNHVLVTFHYYWHNCEDFGFGACTAGIIESTDGGNNWTVHDPNPGWPNAGGYNVFFLFNPARGIGNARTWLYGTQGAGYWRTTDAGGTWTKVSNSNMAHGGGQIHYASDGTLYVSSEQQVLRSTDNGATFTSVGQAQYQTSVFGDGRLLYTVPTAGGVVHTSPETSGTSWTAGTQNFSQGPFEMAVGTNGGTRVVFASMWGAGVWATPVAN